jgi:hypothetical protein
MNPTELDLAGHPVIQQLTRRIEALEALLQADHAKLEKLEHEVEHDHQVIGKIEHKSIQVPPPHRPTHVAVGL